MFGIITQLSNGEGGGESCHKTTAKTNAPPPRAHPPVAHLCLSTSAQPFATRRNTFATLRSVALAATRCPIDQTRAQNKPNAIPSGVQKNPFLSSPHNRI